MRVAYLAFVAAALPALLCGSEPEEQLLQVAHVATSGPGLVDYFRKRMPPGPEPAVVAALVQQLSDPSQPARERAAGALVCFGPYAVLPLRRAANGIEDADRVTRAKACLQFVEGAVAANLTVHAVRQVAVKLPVGGVAALLGYLPYAENHDGVREIEAALAAYAAPGKTADLALVAALKDPSPVRRAAAAVVLCRYGPTQYAAVRPLLADPAPTVRFRAALGLVGSHDSEAVPVLIDLLSDLPPAQRVQAEQFLAGLAGDWAVVGPKGNDRVANRLRRAAWSAWWKTVDGPLLLDEFRSRTLNDTERERILVLIASLDGDVEAREKASSALVAVGRRAVPLLRRAARGGDRKAQMAALCLGLIERESPAPLPAAAARLLALRRPEGTLETLLAYLPFAESDGVADQVVDILEVVGCRDGKPDARLVRALADKAPERRGAAATALCRAGAIDHLPAVRRLLQDPEVEVRLRTALALAACRDRTAIPVLVTLLSEVPIDKAWEVEEFLTDMAGDNAPDVCVTNDKSSGARAREAWAAWWRDWGPTTELPRATQMVRHDGNLLVVESYDQARRSGRVAEFDTAGKARWQIDGLQYPQHVEVLPGERVLVTEQNLNRVTERDHSGKVLWEKSVPGPFRAQRHRNGSTFIAGRQQLVEFDREGRETFRYQQPGESFLSARKLRNGQFVLVTHQGKFARLDARGQEIKTFRVPINANFGTSGADILPDDHVILSTPNLNKVAEYGPDGKVVWEATVNAPGLPNRLVNGHILVVSQVNSCITELDRNGRLVGERRDLNIRPWFASQR